MTPVGVHALPLIEQLRQSTEILKQTVDKNAALSRPIDPPLATSGQIGTKINTYA